MAVSSLNEIARRAGVSPQTVSRVLRGGTKGLRSDAVARSKAVFDAAEQLGYRPNSSARAMQRGRFNAIGWIQATDRYASSVPAPLMHGVQESIASRDLHLVLARLSDSQLTSDQFVPKVLHELLVDGLLVSYTQRTPERLVRLVTDHSIPSIWLNVVRDTDSVRPNDYEGAKMATERLIRLGHKRIAFVNYSHDREFMYSNRSHYSLVHRHDGYMDTMREAGLEPRVILAPFMRDEGVFPMPQVATSFLEEKNHPTAVLAYGDWGLYRLRCAVEKILGDRNALSVITFGSGVSEVEGEVYDTVVIPEFRIGQVAIDMLNRKIESPKKQLPSEVLPCELVGGFSVFPA